MTKLLSLKTALISLCALIVILAIATFIEKYDSAQTVWDMVYSSFWFEGIIVLLALILCFNILAQRMFTFKKITLLFIHISVVCILVGALISKHFAFQGKMYLTLHENSNIMHDKEYSMNIEIIKNGQKATFHKKGEPKFNFSFNAFDENYSLKNNYYEKHVKQLIQPDESGHGVVDFDVIFNNERKRYLFDKFGRTYVDGVEIVFNKNPLDFKKPYFKMVANEHQMIHFISNVKITTNFEENFAANKIHEFHPGNLYKINNIEIMADNINTLAQVITQNDKEQKAPSALYSTLKINDKITSLVLIQSSKHYNSFTHSYSTKDKDILLSWEKKKTLLPFSLTLLENKTHFYPGSDMASAYESKIQIVQNKQILKPMNLKTNHPITVGFYTLFQTKSNFDQGTIIHVNYNPAKWIIYLGYILLSCALLLHFFKTFFNKESTIT